MKQLSEGKLKYRKQAINLALFWISLLVFPALVSGDSWWLTNLLSSPSHERETVNLFLSFPGIKCQDANTGVAAPVPVRPISLGDLYNTSSCVEPPITCPHPRIQFYLYTRRTQQAPELMDTLRPASLSASRFNADHPTKVVIHGFGGGRNLAPSTDIRDGKLDLLKLTSDTIWGEGDAFAIGTSL